MKIIAANEIMDKYGITKHELQKARESVHFPKAHSIGMFNLRYYYEHELDDYFNIYHKYRKKRGKYGCDETFNTHPSTQSKLLVDTQNFYRAISRVCI